ncbi:MAG TPA: 4-alpha-glucanotransferase [Clostridiales bacterium]|nr:4-alpha-glucanotransferase [Clostridiales bacterium]
MEKITRKSGILMHITSLPNDYGWGCFSVSATNFIDFLKAGGFGVWQVLPFSECLYENSPYSAVSSFAINPYFLDLTEFLSSDEIFKLGIQKNLSLFDYKLKFDNALEVICEKYRNEYDLKEFEKTSKYWLDSYALFKVLKKYNDFKPWFEWPDNFKNKNKTALEEFRLKHKQEISDIKLIQFLLDRQWKKIKTYANLNGIEIFGDIPFYVELDSADVWDNPKNWMLENGKPKLKAGVPPDYFNSEGQLWGYPIYNFSGMSKSGYDFWLKRIKRQSEIFDILRIDHFVAFSKFWAVNANSKTAKSGKWMQGPGEALLKLITNKCKIKLVAEDLGIVTSDVMELKENFGIPGVKVLQFAFDGVGDNMYQPHNYEKNCVAYLGTHDNNTMMGMLNEGDWDKINRFKKYLTMPLQEGNDSVIENSILALYKSSANLIILTTQDMLHLGAESRMNVPGQMYGNWTWQLSGELDKNMCGKYYDLAYTYGRIK